MKAILLLAALLLPVAASANTVSDRADQLTLTVLHAEQRGDITPPQAERLVRQILAVDTDNLQLTAGFNDLSPSAEDHLMTRLDVIVSNYRIYAHRYAVYPGVTQ